MDDRQRIASIETRTLDSTGSDAAPRQSIRYQLSNHLGSVCLELDELAQISSYEEYTPFGSTSYQATASQTETPKRYRYTGKERDEATRFYYYGARYYAPWIGRWLSPDPAGIIDGLNLFVYVANNPIRFWDSGGEALESVWDIANIGMGVVSLGANVTAGNYGGAAVDAVGVVIDTAALVAPGVPGGAGTAIRAYRATETAVDVVQTVRQADRVVDATRNAERAAEGVDAVRHADRVEDAASVDPPANLSWNEFQNKMGGEGKSREEVQQAWRDYKRDRGMPEKPSNQRQEYGLSNSRIRKQALHDYWEGAGLARRVNKGGKEVMEFKVTDAQGKVVWLAEKTGAGKQQIDIGHRTGAVQFQKTLMKREKQLIDGGASPEEARKQIKELSMKFQNQYSNFVPQLSKLNRSEGARQGVSYADEITYAKSIEKEFQQINNTTAEPWVGTR